MQHGQRRQELRGEIVGFALLPLSEQCGRIGDVSGQQVSDFVCGGPLAAWSVA